MKYFLLFAMMILAGFGQAQTSKCPGFEHVPAQRYNTLLRMPWTGGMDSPEFSEVGFEQ